METRFCAGCGVGIEGRPVTFRGRDFCGDQCCEEFEETFALKGGPEEDELDEDLDDGIGDDFDEDEFDDEDLDLDDDEDEDEDDFDLDEDD